MKKNRDDLQAFNLAAHPAVQAAAERLATLRRDHELAEQRLGELRADLAGFAARLEELEVDEAAGAGDSAAVKIARERVAETRDAIADLERRPRILERAIEKLQADLDAARAEARAPLHDLAQGMLLDLHAPAVKCLREYAALAGRSQSILDAAARAGLAIGRLGPLAVPAVQVVTRPPREGAEPRLVALDEGAVEEVATALEWLADRALHPPAPPPPKPAPAPVEMEILGERPEDPEEWKARVRAERR
jgi:hypothetical protein